MIGRSAGTDIVLAAPGVSKEHARIQWNGRQWLLRDLRSRNGTRVNDRLLVGTELRLVLGDLITFGDPAERWEWFDDSPPVASAMRADGTVLEASGGALLLPDDSMPLASVFAAADGWELDMGGAIRRVHDGEWLVVGGEHYRLHLPVSEDSSQHTQSLPSERRLLDARLRFNVSLDEEHVEITLELGDAHRRLAARAFHYMLLLLARARLADAAAGIPDGETGWVYADDLATQLGLDIATLNVHVHRARRIAAAQKAPPEPDQLWFDDAHELVQRRPSQIRLGVRDVVIEGTVH
jgi:hypothetical protein